MSGLNTERLRRAAEIKRLIAAHEADIKALKKEFEAIEETALDDLADSGLDSVRVSDGDRNQTVFIKSQTFARNIKGPDATAAALEAAGYGHMVAARANANSVSALVRDLMEANDGNLPPEFEGVIEPYEKLSLGVRLA